MLKFVWWASLKSASPPCLNHIVLMRYFYTQHSTFWPQDITMKSSPYRVTRIGWGCFTIYVDVVLKPGYLWDRSDSKALRLEWDLDFDGHGSSFSNDYGVKIVGGGG